jgi:hypothetical protein
MINRHILQSIILELANKRALQQTKNVSLEQLLQDKSFFDDKLFGRGLKSATKKKIVFEGDYEKVYDGYKVLSNDGKLIDEGRKCREGKQINDKTGRCVKKKVEKKVEKKPKKKTKLELAKEKKKEEQEQRANKFYSDLEDNFSTLYLIISAIDNVFYEKKKTEKTKKVEKEVRKVYDEIKDFLDDKPFFDKITSEREYLGTELENSTIDKYSDSVFNFEKRYTGYTPVLDEDGEPTGRYKKGSVDEVKKAMELNERLIDKVKKFFENVLKPAPDEIYSSILRHYGLETIEVIGS